MPFDERLFEPLFLLVNPGNRLFYVYSLSALVIGLIVLLPKMSLKKGLQTLLNPKVWFHQSAQIDIQFMFFNAFVKGCIFFFVTLSSYGFAKVVMRALNDWFPNFEPFYGSYEWVIAIYALISFLALDFSRFFQHFLFHKIPFLWRFHKIHHSALVLTPLTLYRTHPVESVVGAFRKIFVIGLVSGVFLFLTRSVVSGYAILGVNVFDFAFNFFGSNLRHSHIWLSFGPLNYLFISPAQHQVHHSRAPKHYDKNFGVALALWDLVFGTFYQVKNREFLIFGVRGEKYGSLWQGLKAPFKSAN